MQQFQQQKNLQEVLDIRGSLDPRSMERLNQVVPPSVKNLQQQILTKEQQAKDKRKAAEDDEEEALQVL